MGLLDLTKLTASSDAAAAYISDLRAKVADDQAQIDALTKSLSDAVRQNTIPTGPATPVADPTTSNLLGGVTIKT